MKTLDAQILTAELVATARAGVLVETTASAIEYAIAQNLGIPLDDASAAIAVISGIIVVKVNLDLSGNNLWDTWMPTLIIQEELYTNAPAMITWLENFVTAVTEEEN